MERVFRKKLPLFDSLLDVKDGNTCPFREKRRSKLRWAGTFVTAAVKVRS